MTEKKPAPKASWESKRPRPSTKPAPVTSGPLNTASVAPESGAETTAAPEATPEPTATELAAERGAPAPRVAADVRAAQTAHVKSEKPLGDLDLSDGEIQGLTIRSELRRSDDGAVTHLRCELRDGRLLDISAGEGELRFRVAQ